MEVLRALIDRRHKRWHSSGNILNRHATSELKICRGGARGASTQPLDYRSANLPLSYRGRAPFSLPNHLSDGVSVLVAWTVTPDHAPEKGRDIAGVRSAVIKAITRKIRSTGHHITHDVCCDKAIGTRAAPIVGGLMLCPNSPEMHTCPYLSPEVTSQVLSELQVKYAIAARIIWSSLPPLPQRYSGCEEPFWTRATELYKSPRAHCVKSLESWAAVSASHEYIGTKGTAPETDRLDRGKARLDTTRLPTKAMRVRFPAGSLLDFRTWEPYRTMLLVGGFSRGFPVSPPLHSSAAAHSPHLDVKSRLNLFTRSLTEPRSALDCFIRPCVYLAVENAEEMHGSVPPQATISNDAIARKGGGGAEELKDLLVSRPVEIRTWRTHPLSGCLPSDAVPSDLRGKLLKPRAASHKCRALLFWKDLVKLILHEAEEYPGSRSEAGLREISKNGPTRLDAQQNEDDADDIFPVE
ncbi:hypothetical protein PR048_031591 [Dryococelus australis]|uniref:Uncharacterized protein n=1 Tax=Dryococelus australis TaxID=614101 RepID=A0ABQ9G5R2_9NEOP|nr:hypothetical protein PR048_031591 [Dryococelus australis]